MASMPERGPSMRILSLLTFALLMACQQQAPTAPGEVQPAAPESVAYTNANVWDGTGAPMLRGATLVVAEGRVQSVSMDEPPAGARVVDLDGAFVIPGLINSHGHITANWGNTETVDPVERVREGLEVFARYGVTTVLSLGGAPDEAFAVRDAQDPANPEFARAFLAGPVVADTTAAAARETSVANVERNADWLKLRVDDNLGRGQKMPWEAVQAVIDVGREAGLAVATHMYYLDDAKRLLDMGTGMIAHSIRDLPVDDEFVASLDASGVCYVPTLTREVSTFVYADRPEFFDDPFFQRGANADQIARVSDPEFIQNMAQSDVAAAYRVALDQAMLNLGSLYADGAKIGMGTDSGPLGRFPGYFEHLELTMMVEAGMSPEDALLSATGVAAECIDRSDVGTLEAGRWADFLVLAEDPTVDILATRTLQRVFLAGNELR